MAGRIATGGAPNRHRWRRVCRGALDHREMEMLRRSLDSVAGELTRMIAGAEHACALFELPRPETFGEAGRLLAFVEAAAIMPECDRQAFRDPGWDSVDDVVPLGEKGVRFSKLKAAFDSAVVEAAWNASLDECRTMLMQKGRSLFRLFSSRYRAQVALLNSYLNVPLPKTIEQRLLLVDGLIAAQVARRSFEDLQASGCAAFGIMWRKERSDWTKLGSFITWWTGFPKESLPDGARDCLARVTLSAQDRKLLETLRKDFQAAKAGVDRLIDFLQLDTARIQLDVADDMSITGIVNAICD